MSGIKNSDTSDPIARAKREGFDEGYGFALAECAREGTLEADCGAGLRHAGAPTLARMGRPPWEGGDELNGWALVRGAGIESFAQATLEGHPHCTVIVRRPRRSCVVSLTLNNVRLKLKGNHEELTDTVSAICHDRGTRAWLQLRLAHAPMVREKFLGVK